MAVEVALDRLARISGAPSSATRGSRSCGVWRRRTNIRGPFYREGAPFRVDLAEPDEPGERLTIAGRVMGLPDCEPLGAAVLDVWQANARGLYSNMLGLARRGDHGRFRLRGKIPAAGDGHYRFETIIPGHYPLWFLTRPRHIHFIVSHPRYAPLTTQLFFAGDRYLASDPPGER
jgi:protocatechuate 3,4-dioxygenase beta subunit